MILRAAVFRYLAVILGVTLGGWQTASVAAQAFGFQQVQAQAQALAGQPYQPPAKVPQAAADIDRQTWSNIHYRRDHALWHKNHSRFQVEFFHAGSFYKSAVKINQITQQGVQPIAFSKAGFIYPEKGMAESLPDNIGYSGFRLEYPVNRDDKMDEVATFLGASYFRLLGKGQVYGLSGRGVAIDTAMDSGEEFPRFREFWLKKPKADAKQITVYALLDGPSVTGAYRFVIRPGTQTVMDVKARLYTRKPVKKLGLAALTSMFMYGGSSFKASHDWRPELHDSDGLLLVNGDGEWLWRPLVNPDQIAINGFQASAPKGFGLIQSDREFNHYHDLDDNYDRRPDAWVTPSGDWGKGRVELVQIPSGTEQTDNMVAYWVPDKPVKAGQALAYDYRIDWGLARPVPPTVGLVRDTLIGEIPIHENAPKRARRIIVEFAGGPLKEQPDNAQPDPKITVGEGGKLMDSVLRRNPHSHGWQLQLDVLPETPDKVVELRAFLADKKGEPLSETWSYGLNQ